MYNVNNWVQSVDPIHPGLMVEEQGPPRKHNRKQVWWETNLQAPGCSCSRVACQAVTGAMGWGMGVGSCLAQHQGQPPFLEQEVYPGCRVVFRSVNYLPAELWKVLETC